MCSGSVAPASWHRQARCLSIGCCGASGDVPVRGWVGMDVTKSGKKRSWFLNYFLPNSSGLCPSTCTRQATMAAIAPFSAASLTRHSPPCCGTGAASCWWRATPTSNWSMGEWLWSSPVCGIRHMARTKIHLDQYSLKGQKQLSRGGDKNQMSGCETLCILKCCHYVPGAAQREGEAGWEVSAR